MHTLTLYVTTIKFLIVCNEFSCTVLNTKCFKNDCIFSALCNAVNTSGSKALTGLQKEELEGDLGKSYWGLR